MWMDQEERISVGSYAFLSFLTLLNVMNFVDRQLLASFANFIVPDLRDEGYRVTYREFDGPHWVPKSLARMMMTWLKR